MKTIKEMKVLNIAQPYAHYVMHKGKNVENRSKPTGFRGTIAIYASKTIDRSRFKGSDELGVSEEDCAYGCIIGFIDIVDCITPDDVTKKTEEWFSGPFGYILERVILLKKPIPVTPPQGAVIWWNLTGPDLQKCLSQLSPKDLSGMNPVPCEAKPENTKKRVRKPKQQDDLHDDENAPLFDVSSELSSIIGQNTVTPKELVLLLWGYIEKNDLQDHKNKRIIHCDKKLQRVFGKDKVYVSELLKLIEVHLKPSDDPADT